MAFSRAINTAKFPAELGPALQKDATDLFRKWLMEGKDFMRVAMNIKRSKAHTVDVKDGWGFVKLRTLGYTEEKKKISWRRRRRTACGCTMRISPTTRMRC